jgi:hypothetical protein
MEVQDSDNTDLDININVEDVEDVEGGHDEGLNNKKRRASDSIMATEKT